MTKSYCIQVDESYFYCPPQQSLLISMSRAGFEFIPVGCCSGGCGVCKVQVIKGQFETGVMSREKICPQERNNGVVLACKTYPKSDLIITTSISKNVTTTLENENA